MIEVCKIFGVKSKEHNGDYLSSEEIKQRFDCGLDALNIAPEFGQIETLCYLETIQDIEEWYKICYESKRWEKWVSKDFIPEQNKEELIKNLRTLRVITSRFSKNKNQILIILFKIV